MAAYICPVLTQINSKFRFKKMRKVIEVKGFANR